VPALPIHTPSGGGAVLAFVRCAQSHNVSRYLVQESIATVQLFCFTFDLEDFCDDLMSTVKRGVSVSVHSDQRTTLNQITRDQLQRLRALRLTVAVFTYSPVWIKGTPPVASGGQFLLETASCA
jgi:hypothetical protein